MQRATLVYWAEAGRVQGDGVCAVARSMGHVTLGEGNVQGRGACGWGGSVKEWVRHEGAGGGRGECA